MKWFYDPKISTKLISSFLVVLALTAGMGAFAILQLGAVNPCGAGDPGQLDAVDARGGRHALFCRQLPAEGKPQYPVPKWPRRKPRPSAKQWKRASSSKPGWTPTNNCCRTTKTVSCWPSEKRLNAYLAASQQLLELSRQNQEAQARALLRGESKTHFDELTNRLQKMVELNDAGATVAGDRGSVLSPKNPPVDHRDTGRGAADRPGPGPVHRADYFAPAATGRDRLTNQLAEGDLTAPIAPGSKDETGMVLNAMRDMVGKLAHIIGEVRNAADNLASASGASQRHRAVDEPGHQRTGRQRRGNQRVGGADEREHQPEHRKRQGHRWHG